MDATNARRAVLALMLVYVAYRTQKFVRWQRWAAKLMPGPPVSLLKGNIDVMIKAGGFTEQLFIDLHAQYGDILRFFIFPNMHNVSIADPDLVADVYKLAPTRPLETYMFLWYLGKENLLFQKGKMVKDMRLIYGTMITERAQLDKLHELSMKEFRPAVDKWVTAADQPARPIDLFKTLGPIVYDIMGQWLFDAPWLVTDVGQKVYALHKHLIEDVNRWLLWAALPVGPLFHPAYIKYLMDMREWRRLVGTLIDQRSKDMRENPAKYEKDKSAITTILRAKREDGKPFFSRERAISTFCGFLNGAYDTTHCTLTWITFHLAKYPETQQKLFDEFTRLNIPTDPNVDDLRRCDYLQAFIMESMRMKSTVPVNQRVNLDEDITVGGYLIPKGTNINIPNGVICKDERWYGRAPEEFRPERFMGDSAEAVRAKDSWMQFGGHSRMCIGFRSAEVELRAYIHTVVTRSVVSLEDPNEDGAFKIEAGVNQPERHFKVIFRQRDLRKMREAENLAWWMSQITAMEQFKAPGANVAPTA